jgi:Beta-propeller repeat
MRSTFLSLVCLSVFASAQGAASKPATATGYGSLPPSFEANLGQTDAGVKFLSRGHGYTLFLTSRSAVLSLQEGAKRSTVVMSLVRSNETPAVTGVHILPGKSNYFIGNDPRKWKTNVPSYSEVLYQDVYPNINLLYHANQRQAEFDFQLAPHADANLIELGFEGADGMRVDGNGDLILSVSGSQLRFHRPRIFQPPTASSKNRKTMLDGSYVLNDGRIRFQLPPYDHSRALIIDPVLSYSTFLAGSNDNFGNAIAVDKAGNAYIAGGTTSSDFPTTSKAFQKTYAGDNGFGYQGVVGDVFVTKLNASGNAVIYSTYIGGSGGDNAYGIALDPSGNVYLTGATNSLDFPETAGAWQPVCCGLNDVFVTKLNATGSALIYSTHVGVGGEGTRGFGIDIDSTGAAYVTGNAGPGFPTTPGALKTECNCFTDGFVFKLNPAATTAAYSTFLGGSTVDFGESIAVDAAGHAFVTGYSSSNDFPTTPNAYQLTNRGGVDAFVSVLNTNGSSLIYSTLLGGSSNEEGYKIAIRSGKAYVTGPTSSTDLPVTAGAFQTQYGGGNSDAYVAEIDTTKSGAASLVYATFLGGSGDENLADFQRNILGVDTFGNVFLTGITTSTDFPTVHPVQSSNAGGWDAFVATLNSTGTKLRFSTYLGGSSDDFARAIAYRGGSLYVTGQTFSGDFPTSAGAYQTSFKGTSDAFVTKISPGTLH